MTKNEVLKNLKSIVATEKELKNEVISAFEDYNFCGVTEIIVDFEENCTIRAFANHPESDIFYIEYKQINDQCEVVFVELH